MGRFVLTIVLLGVSSFALPTKPQEKMIKEFQLAAGDNCPDVVFIVDASETMAYRLFDKAKVIMREMIKAAAGGNFAIVGYGTNAKILSDINSKEATLRYLDTKINAVQPSGSARMASGIKFTVDRVVPKMKKGRKMAVIITDGPSSECVCPSSLRCIREKDYGKYMRDKGVFAALIGLDFHSMVWTNAMFDQQCLVAKLSNGKPAYVSCKHCGEDPKAVERAASKASELMCTPDKPFAFATAATSLLSSMMASLDAFVSQKAAAKSAAKALGVEPPHLIMLGMISLAVVLMGVYLVIAWRKHQERKRIQRQLEQEEAQRVKQDQPSYGAIELWF